MRWCFKKSSKCTIIWRVLFPNSGVLVFRGFLNTLKAEFQNSNFLLIYSVIHFKDFHFSEFLVLKYLKNLETQTPLLDSWHTLNVT